MTDPPLYPLRFEPIFQYRLWGGRRLAEWLDAALPGDRPIGEAWLLSDRDDHPSRVAEGPLKGRTIAQLMAPAPELVLGNLARRFQRFPLLLKFLDVQKMLSVQVHPRDSQAALIPEGESGKTEAWVVLEAGPEGRIYAGLQPGTTPADLRALSARSADDHLASFAPRRGQGVLIEAGTVHAVGNGVVVFEVQENSDVTFRLYDWDHIDPTTGHKRRAAGGAGAGLRRFWPGCDRAGDAGGPGEAARRSANGSSSARISACGACKAGRPSRSAPWRCRGSWCASTAVVTSSMTGPSSRWREVP